MTDPTVPPALDRTLDPADWDQFRQLGHRMMDDVVDFLASIRERPVWTSAPSDANTLLDQPLPVNPTDGADVYREFRQAVMPYGLGNIHPRFWGWVIGSGAPIGVLADLLAAAMNCNAAGYDQAPARVESQVIRWLAEVMGLPVSASGLFVSSGSQANLIGLAVARSAKAGFTVREAGLAGSPQLVVYCSSEAHQCIRKGAELLGLGAAGLRYVPVDDAFAMDVDALAEMVAADRAAGLRPICVVGSAGTVNTGSIDDLRALAELCRREDLWFHVDGAIGAVATMSPRIKLLLAGLEQADSIAFDMHKWMYLPYDIAGVLVRDASAHRATFEYVPSYLAPAGRGVAPDALQFAQLGVDLSRGFRALKAWMALKTYGISGYAAMVEQNIDQAAHLAMRITSEPNLELLAPVSLNIVCFRFIGAANDPEMLRRTNQEILVALQERGIAITSSAMLRGQFGLRVAIVNHRSRREDFDLLVEAVVKIGGDVAARLAAID